MDNEYDEVAERATNTFIIYPEVESIWNKMDSVRIKNNKRENKYKNDPPGHLFIMGKSRCGKTQLVKMYAEKNPGYVHVDEHGNEIDIKPVVYMQVPHPFATLEFYQCVIHDALGAPRLRGKATIGDAKNRVFTLLDKMRVEMLILDEFDYLLESTAVTPTNAMETIKYISNKGKLTLVCVGQPKIDELRKLDFQYFMRYMPVKMNRFKECDNDFCQFLLRFENDIKPPICIRLGDKDTGIPQVLFKMSNGLVGMVERIIYESYRELGKLYDRQLDKDLKLTVNILIEAYKTVISDLQVDEFEKMLNE